MSVILQTLSQLDAALQKLEFAAQQQGRNAPKTSQQDLFMLAASNGNRKQGVFTNGKNVIDVTALVSRLDTAIERVEQVLKEG